MPRIPRGLHAQGVRNTGAPPYRPPKVPQEEYTTVVRSLIQAATGQQSVSGAGKATVVLGPQGLGTRWYPSQIQVATSTGPTDGSSCTLYRGFIDPKQEIGQTLQGGGDTLGFTHDMQVGDLIYAVWVNANAGDLATMTVHGDQQALAS